MKKYQRSIIRYRRLCTAILGGIITLFLFSCEDFVALDPPPTETTTDNVFTNNATATSALLGIYSEMFNNATMTNKMTIANGLAADELTIYQTGVREQFYDNTLLPDNSEVASFWSSIYTYIYSANAILEGLAKHTGVSDSTKVQLEGEARLIRAFCHFYLTNLWGDVPLVTTTDFRINASALRTPKVDVYGQVIEDLKTAETLLAGDYRFSEGDRSRPNRSAATALLARVYLYLQDWANAETATSTVISNPAYGLVGELNEVFLANSSEAIWQLSSTWETGLNTRDGGAFILDAPPNFIALNDEIIGAFEAGDDRLTDWIGSFTEGPDTWYYPFKYKIADGGNNGTPITEYLMIIRLAEMHLIRAEARARQNNVTGAQEDLNIIRHRATLGNTPASDQASLLLAIEHERRMELFTEWGHRWLDLKRTGRASDLLRPIKPGWQPTDELYPIPLAEIGDNPNLTQNSGY
ncbi:MAG: RagB/SusD family nutrient uptake outer membrane protein [Cytophagales bacterium]|nr:RagB/SusD family nutrient uptake outer membrane protein [Cytophagales bacterium]